MTTATPRRAATGPPLRRVLALITAVLLASLSAGVATAASGSGTPDAQGYWWRSPALAVDQTVPDGGLVVAGQPEGPLAVSALRFELDDPSVRGASIHLTVDTDSREAFVEEPLLWACPPEQDWEPAEGGSWDEAPGENCSPGTSAEGELGEDEEEYVFVVSQFIQNGQIDVMITPGVRGAVPSPLLMQELNAILIEQVGTGGPWPGPPTSPPGSSEGPDGSNFRVTFAPPDEDTLRTGQDSADESVTKRNFESDTDFGFDEPEEGESSDDFGSSSDGGSSDGGSSAGGSSAGTPSDTDAGASPSTGDGLGEATEPQTAEPPEPTDDGAGPADDPGGQEQPVEPQTEEPVTAGPSDDGQAMDAATPAGAEGGFDARLLGALILGLGALGAGGLSFGPQAASGLGGLGPFARPRTGKPPQL